MAGEVNNGVLKKLLLLSFCLSGMASLIYEVVWVRPLQLIFGSTVYAVSMMLALLLLGFAIGSFLFRKYADNIKEPLHFFITLEFAIGIYGLVVVHLLGAVQAIYIAVHQSLPGAQFLLSSVLLLIPSIMIGATWPVVSRCFIITEEEVGKDSALLYSFNSFGAMFGSLAAGFILIPALGVSNAAVFAASFNLIAALIIFTYVKQGNGSKKEG